MVYLNCHSSTPAVESQFWHGLCVWTMYISLRVVNRSMVLLSLCWVLHRAAGTVRGMWGPQSSVLKTYPRSPRALLWISCCWHEQKIPIYRSHHWKCPHYIISDNWRGKESKALKYVCLCRIYTLWLFLCLPFTVCLLPVFVRATQIQVQHVFLIWHGWFLKIVLLCLFNDIWNRGDLHKVHLS